MNSYKELTVYQKAVELSVYIYRTTEGFPKSELYGLTNQIRRCAVSIPSNIAEGQRRGHRAEYVQFLRVAFGSGSELETQLLISYKVGYLNKEGFEELSEKLDEIMRMLNKLISVLVKPK
ncbi:four helix bundle protein [Candidatus Daviesbacteria bacterium]|nr:four helix bundle protein [Candidatus Daviesbacteria bacterium]